MFPTFPQESLFNLKRFQPTAVAFTTASTGTGLGTATHTNDGQAYDGSLGTAADLNVAEIFSPPTTGTLSQIATYSLFGTGTYSGVLSVLAISDTIQASNVPVGTAVATSSALLEYSIDAGSNWTTLASIDGTTLAQWQLGYPWVHYFSTPIDVSKLQVRATAIGATTNAGTTDKAGASADLQIFDISFS